jgi:hypothetical protein
VQLAHAIAPLFFAGLLVFRPEEGDLGVGESVVELIGSEAPVNERPAIKLAWREAMASRNAAASTGASPAWTKGLNTSSQITS